MKKKYKILQCNEIRQRQRATNGTMFAPINYERSEKARRFAYNILFVRSFV